mgnify:CR=1 FL=1
MDTKIARIENVRECSAALEEAGSILRHGGLVAFPTETVYGLGGNGLDGSACAEIYHAKGRPSDNPLILHVANRAMVDCAVKSVPLMAEKLMAAFCPGPITLIMEKSDAVPKSITGGLSTVGIRMPDHDVARAMIQAAGVPIAAPSANLSGRPSPTTAEAVRKDMDGRIPMILDGGACRFGVESTIVDCTAGTAMILRPGAITREMLREVLGEVELDPALVGEDTVPRAPGMKYRHYAPKAPMTLLEGSPKGMLFAFEKEARRLREQGRQAGVIASTEVIAGLKGILPQEFLVDYGRQGDFPSIAANIYEALRSFDDKPVDCLLAEGTTEDGLGLAIMNRMRKASGFQSMVVE